MHFLERVNRAHLAALRLRSELESSAPPGAGVPECLGSISGNVQGPGGPMANIMVEAYLAAGGSEGSGLTDISGNYQIDSLPVGDYYVVTSNVDGLIDEVYNNVDCPGGACDPTIGSAVNVSPGATTQGVDFTLAAGGRIGVLLYNAQRFECPLQAYPTLMRIFETCRALPAFAEAWPEAVAG